MSLVVKELKETINRQTWIDQLAEPLQNAVSAFYQTTGKAGTILADFFHGSWLGHPLHPVITDVPVGSWIAAVVLDQMESSTGRSGFGRSADTAVTIGVVSAVGAAAAGLTDWQHLQGESRRTGFLHAALNTVALLLFAGSMVSRKNNRRGAGRALALAGLGVAGAGAYLGGDLVFRQKIGTNHAPDDLKVSRFQAVCRVDELPENKPVRKMFKETPLVFVRRGEQVYALAERCAHLGGPLSEGKLETGEDGTPHIVCPWHSSIFDMENGRVVSGPSAYPQPCLEVRVRDEQVEVRRRLE